jgi:hypothetical protein
MGEELPLILQTIGWGKLYGGDRMIRAMMDDFVTMQTKLQASLDSQTSIMNDLFGHFKN